MDLIQSRQEHSLATGVLLLVAAFCGLLYLTVPPERPALGQDYHIEHVVSSIHAYVLR